MGQSFSARNLWYQQRQKEMVVFFLKKKNYVYWYINENGSIKQDDHPEGGGDRQGRAITETKGLVGSRREHCQFLKRVYADLVDIVMHEGNLHSAVTALIKHINDLLYGRVPIKDLIMIREAGTYGPK